MNLTLAIAIGITIASVLLSYQAPAAMLSWTQRAARRRSLIIVLVLAGASVAAAFDSPSKSTEIYLPFLSLLAAAALSIRQLRANGSAWATGRMLPLTRLASVGAAVGLTYLSLLTNGIFESMTLFAGFWHCVNMRREHNEISKYFIDLQTRLASLEAERRSHRQKFQTSEARDISRTAS